MTSRLARAAAGPHDGYRSRFHGRIIDVHTHFSVGAGDAAVAAVRAAGLGGLVNLVGAWPPQPFEEWRAGWSGDRAVAGMVLFHAPDLAGIGSPDFERNLADDVRRAFELGARGLKIWKQLGLWLTDARGDRVAVDDERLSPMWECAARHRRPAGIHIADPQPFFQPVAPDNPRYTELLERPDWSFAGEEFPSLETLHDEFERLVSAHPATDFVALHGGCFIPFDRLHRMMRRYPNLWLETSARVLDLAQEPAAARALLCDFADRVLFGSDYARMAGWLDQPLPGEYPDLTRAFYARNLAFFETGLDGIGNPFPFQSETTVRGLDLPDDVLEKLYFRNAQRLLDLPAT